MTDPHDLQRFVDAQAPIYDQVLAKVRAGRKRSHWMWFVFPQLRGLGHSAMAERYGIASRDEALAYLDHPLLGPRLVACTTLVTAVSDRSLNAILGSPDDLKFCSSMTLFAQVATGLAPRVTVFADALRVHGDGRRDPRTLALLQQGS